MNFTKAALIFTLGLNCVAMPSASRAQEGKPEAKPDANAVVFRGPF